MADAPRRQTLRRPLRAAHPPDHAGRRPLAPPARPTGPRCGACSSSGTADSQRLDAALGPERDRRRKLVPYGDELLPDDRKQIPEEDMPAGTPPWMRSLKQWATRKGSSAELKRATIEVRVPAGERPWQ